jgi:hypothetical protein
MSRLKQYRGCVPGYRSGANSVMLKKPTHHPMPKYMDVEHLDNAAGKAGSSNCYAFVGMEIAGSQGTEKSVGANFACNFGHFVKLAEVI